MRKKSLIILTTIIIFLSILFSGCFEEENSSYNKIPYENAIYVDDDGGKDYTSIKQAIKKAKNHDIIFIYKGIYNEKIIINKSITLIGENRENTVIKSNQANITPEFIITIEADNCTIKNVKITSNENSTNLNGFNVTSSGNNISNNIISNIEYGIYLQTSSKNNTISRNLITHNQYGLYTDYSTNNNISSNNISHNNQYGIYLFQGSDDNSIQENNISENEYGMRIKGSENNQISKNIIINNRKGLYFCCGADHNIVYYNVFINNTLWNGYDYIGNQWDNGTIGNYWHDYHNSSQGAFDNDEDGIVDSPYKIDGGKYQDRYPLTKPPIKY